MIIGIVGSELAKFTEKSEHAAKMLIRDLLKGKLGVSSGHCHLGGVDIWAEEIGKEMGKDLHIFPPATHRWHDGYRPRNLQIVQASDEVHCITVRELPPDYKGMRFSRCYHCNTTAHVKSGGCWTALQAKKLGKPAFWHVL